MHAARLKEGLSCGAYFIVKSEELVSVVGLVIKIEFWLQENAVVPSKGVCQANLLIFVL